MENQVIEMPSSTEIVVSPTTPSSSVVQPSVSLLEKLPPELRNMIYSMCMVTDPTRIRSPISKRTRKSRPISALWCLLMLNKTIHKEASSWYYTSAEFIFGAGAWGSTVEPNLHAMKAFLNRVKKPQLALITMVQIEVQAIARYRSWNSRDDRPYVLGAKVAVADLRAITRSLLKHFTGLEKIEINLVKSSQWVQVPPHPVWLTVEETVEALRKILLELLKLKSISAIGVFRNKDIPIQEAAKKILESKPEIAKILSVQDQETIFDAW